MYIIYKNISTPWFTKILHYILKVLRVENLCAQVLVEHTLLILLYHILFILNIISITLVIYHCCSDF